MVLFFGEMTGLEDGGAFLKCCKVTRWSVGEDLTFERDMGWKKKAVEY